ncbi:terminase large subunit domain-containing protein [Rubellicoccus peritrichatus]|uniref:Terminase family protein n=1 Tax=Rubellicoccus peritrichatus TaxID=3080537 RepID=A0AAQ3LC66_9BACT|nr:terminase family protein [Puniceicoccus sp. CR14]WOO41170.1 terminase family protein [Puniceicoccus sp. CR14]
MKTQNFFLPYQQRWIEDRSRLKLMEKSRQIGLSWCSAYACVRRQAEGAKLDTWISSRDETQARLFLEDCSAFAGVLNVAAQDLGLQILDGKSRGSAFTLEFASGRRIHSMSSNPDAQAGKRGTRVLDEFALHPDPRRLYSVAYPGITWGGHLEIISTHRGANNYFNELVREIREKGNPKNFSLHRVTLQDALEQGFLQKLKRKLPADDPRCDMDEAAYYDFIRASCADEESFQQEYCCVPADDVSAFLGWDMIAACEYDETEIWEGSLCNAKSLSGNPLYLGVDVGRDHDLTVFWLVELAGDVIRTRLVECLEGVPFSQQETVLYQLLSLPNLRRACIDQSGLGRQFAERAIERFGRYRVEGITFTAPIKEELAYPLRAAFEDHKVRIPADKYIRADLRAIRREPTAAGHVRFSADRGPNGHADRFWALALALHAAKAPLTTYHYETMELNRRTK